LSNERCGRLPNSVHILLADNTCRDPHHASVSQARCVCLCRCKHTCVCTCEYTYIHTHTHTHIYIYILYAIHQTLVAVSTQDTPQDTTHSDPWPLMHADRSIYALNGSRPSRITNRCYFLGLPDESAHFYRPACAEGFDGPCPRGVSLLRPTANECHTPARSRRAPCRGRSRSVSGNDCGSSDWCRVWRLGIRGFHLACQEVTTCVET
jgi:hypothetical protein